MKPILVLFLLFSFNIYAGTETGAGGGNGVAGEFKRVGTFALYSLAQSGEVVIKGRTVDLGALGRSLVDVTIEPVARSLTLYGKDVHAINYPQEKRIEINSAAWDSRDDQTKMQLVFHELWGLAFHDHADDDYSFSSQLVLRVQRAGFENPNRVIALASSRQNGRGQILRALVTRNPGGSDSHDLTLIIQKIQSLDTLDVVTSQVVYSPEELPLGKNSEIENLHFEVDTSAGFEAFSYKTRNGDTDLICRFMLPEPPWMGNLAKIQLQCQPVVSPQEYKNCDSELKVQR